MIAVSLRGLTDQTAWMKRQKKRRDQVARCSMTPARSRHLHVPNCHWGPPGSDAPRNPVSVREDREHPTRNIKSFRTTKALLGRRIGKIAATRRGQREASVGKPDGWIAVPQAHDELDKLLLGCACRVGVPRRESVDFVGPLARRDELSDRASPFHFDVSVIKAGNLDNMPAEVHGVKRRRDHFASNVRHDRIVNTNLNCKYWRCLACVRPDRAIDHIPHPLSHGAHKLNVSHFRVAVLQYERQDLI